MRSVSKSLCEGRRAARISGLAGGACVAVAQLAPHNSFAARGGKNAQKRHGTPRSVFACLALDDSPAQGSSESGIFQNKRGFTLSAGAKTGQFARSAMKAPSSRSLAPGEGRAS